MHSRLKTCHQIFSEFAPVLAQLLSSSAGQLPGAQDDKMDLKAYPFLCDRIELRVRCHLNNNTITEGNDKHPVYGLSHCLETTMLPFKNQQQEVNQ